MSYNVNDTYALDPWDGITLNERTWYDGVLRERYTRTSIYSRHVTMKVDLAAKQSRTIIFNDLIPPHPYVGALPNREMNASRLYGDSFQRKVTVERQGNGMSLHRESQMFNYWTEGGSPDLRAIINRQMGQVVIDHVDLLAQYAYLRNFYAMFGLGSATGFGGINTSTDRLTTDLVDAIWLGMMDRKRIWTDLPVDNLPDEIYCITTPGAIYDLKREVDTNARAANKFVNIAEYAAPQLLFAHPGEIGSYRGIRFVGTQLAELWNCGTVTTQTAIKAAVQPGDGAADPDLYAVDDTFYVGQPGATHSVTVTSTTGFVVGDKVTLHKLRHDGTNPRGVLNGVNYEDPMREDLEIFAIPDSTHLVFKAPYTRVGLDGKGLETDLGSTVYGYVTKGANIHTALFLNNRFSQGVVAGVAQAPRFYMPPAIDDFESIYRITYDMWMKFQPYDPASFEVAFLGGSNKLKGGVFVR